MNHFGRVDCLESWNPRPQGKTARPFAGTRSMGDLTPLRDNLVLAVRKRLAEGVRRAVRPAYLWLVACFNFCCRRVRRASACAHSCKLASLPESSKKQNFHMDLRMHTIPHPRVRSQPSGYLLERVGRYFLQIYTQTPFITTFLPQCPSQAH
jgi:hypothetical protein